MTQSFKPIQIYKRPEVPMTNVTTDKLSYLPVCPAVKEEYPWARKVSIKASDSPFEKATTYKLSFIPNCRSQKAEPLRTKDNRGLITNAKSFDDHTIYKESFFGPNGYCKRSPILPTLQLHTSDAKINSDSAYHLSYPGHRNVQKNQFLQFKNAIMLRNHQKRHLGIKTFVCSQSDCGKEFITSAELTTHIRSHTGSKPFACSMCDKSYKTKSHLTVHYRSHSGARPYACDICPLTFAHNKVLKHHRLVHLGQLPWICDVCQRPFRQRSTLMKHKRLHTDGKIRKNLVQQQAESAVYTESIRLSIELDNLEK